MADLTIGGVYFNEDLDAVFGGSISTNNSSTDFHANASNLIVGSGSGNQGMTIFSGSSVGEYGSIYFADGRSDGQEEYRGMITYEQNNEVMRFHTNTVEALELDLSQNATFAGNVHLADSKYATYGGTNAAWELEIGVVGDNAYITKSSTTSGHLYIKNNGTSKDIIFQNGGATALTIDSSQNSTFTGNIVLDDNSGASPQVQWINGSNDTGGMYLNSSGKLQIVTGGSLRQEISSGSTEFTGNAMPSADSTYDLGTTSDRWSTLYVDNITITNDLPGGPYVPLAGGTMTGNLNVSGNLSIGGNINKTSGDLTLDVAGDIILDADGSDIRLYDGTQYGKFRPDSGNFRIYVTGDNKDLEFWGVDDTSEITALTLDMSDSGTAIFNHHLSIPDYITHYQDASTRFGFSGPSTFVVNTGGTTALTIDSSQDATFAGDINISNGTPVLTLTDTSSSATTTITLDGVNTTIDSNGTDGDIIFKGSDGGSEITALTLDMSENGDATFKGNVTLNTKLIFDYGGDHYLQSGTDSLAYKTSGGTAVMSLNASTYAATFSGTLTIPSYIYHTSDPSDDTYFGFSGNDTFVVYTAGGNGLNIDSNRDVTITGELYGPNGTKAIPTYSFTSDTDTGIYLEGTGNMALTAGGSATLTLESTAVTAKTNIVLDAADIQLDTAVSASTSSGTIIKFGSTVSMSAGQVVYGSNSMGSLVWAGTDADTGTKNILGLALGTSPTSDGILLNGIYHSASHGFTVGLPLYISTTGGEMTTTAPSGSGDYVRVVGYAIDSNHIYFCPDNTWVEIA